MSHLASQTVTRYMLSLSAVTCYPRQQWHALPNSSNVILNSDMSALPAVTCNLHSDQRHAIPNKGSAIPSNQSCPSTVWVCFVMASLDIDYCTINGASVGSFLTAVRQGASVASADTFADDGKANQHAVAFGKLHREVVSI